MDVTVVAAATAITLHALAYAGFQLIWGPLSTRWGRVRVLVLSTSIAAAANLASALAPDLTWFLVARTVSGGAFAATFAAVLTYVGDAVPLSRRPSAMSNLATATALGLSLGAVASSAAVTWISWRWVFGCFAVITAAIVFLLARLPDPAGADEVKLGRQIGQLGRNRWALAVCALVAVEGFLLIGVYNLLPVALQQAGGDVLVSGLATGAFGVAVIAVSQGMKALVGRVSAWVFVAAGGACAVSAFIVLAVGVSTATVVAGASLMGAAWALAHTTLQTWMTDAAAQTRALGMTLFSISLMAGGAVGAAVGALAAGADRFAVLFALCTVLAAGFAAAGALGRRRYRVRAD